MYIGSCSNFSDVFDEDHFIEALANDVKVINKLPKELANTTRAVKHFRSWSGLDYYEDEIASMWKDYQVCPFEMFLVDEFYQTLLFLLEEHLFSLINTE